MTGILCHLLQIYTQQNIIIQLIYLCIVILVFILFCCITWQWYSSMKGIPFEQFTFQEICCTFHFCFLWAYYVIGFILKLCYLNVTWTKTPSTYLIADTIIHFIFLNVIVILNQTINHKEVLIRMVNIIYL